VFLEVLLPAKSLYMYSPFKSTELKKKMGYACDDDGCEKVCKNPQALKMHKQIHNKKKGVDVDMNSITDREFEKLDNRVEILENGNGEKLEAFEEKINKKVENQLEANNNKVVNIIDNQDEPKPKEKKKKEEPEEDKIFECSACGEKLKKSEMDFVSKDNWFSGQAGYHCSEFFCDEVILDVKGKLITEKKKAENKSGFTILDDEEEEVKKEEEPEEEPAEEEEEKSKEENKKEKKKEKKKEDKDELDEMFE